MAEITEGAVFCAPYPFVREIYTEITEEGSADRMSWRPGVSMEIMDDGDTDAVAHGMGEIVLSVISLHKPGRYHRRVFYTRQWRDPDGRSFGKNTLRVAGERAFRSLAGGYRHAFDLERPASSPTPTDSEASR